MGTGSSTLYKGKSFDFRDPFNQMVYEKFWKNIKKSLIRKAAVNFNMYEILKLTKLEFSYTKIILDV